MKNTQATIIIPTHERHDLLKISIDYYKNWSSNIVIADSSEKELSINLPDNFIYLHCPLANFGDKLNIAIAKVSTNYVAICADDDFLAISGIIQGIKFLDGNPNYVSVQGNIISFYKMKSKVIYKVGMSREGYKVDGNNESDRIKKHSRPICIKFIHCIEKLI